MTSTILTSLVILLSACVTVACTDKVRINAPDSQALQKGEVGSVIDDGEDQNNQLLVQDGHAGYWYTYVDDAGSTVEPMAGAQGGSFTMAPGGANGSEFAAHMQGKIAMGGTVYSGMGFSLTDPKGTYDASKYSGLSFYAKKGSGSGNVRVKIPDVSTDPESGVCKQCFNDFGANLELTEHWTRYVLPFSDAQQEPGWGTPRAPSIDPSKLYGVQWQVNTRGAPYDVWVDDVGFTK